VLKPSPPHHLLLVDDDERLSKLLKEYLCQKGFQVSTVFDIEEAQKALVLFTFDLILLDIMLPKRPGYYLLEKYKQNLPPIILLSAKGELDDRLKGLALGADDYLPKPFNPEELVLRIFSVLRRSEKQKSVEKMRYIGSLTFDTKTGILKDQQRVIPLTESEEKLLRLFLDNLSRLISREEIGRWLGGKISHRSIDVQISRLRSKIEQHSVKERYLQAVRGKGYILNLS
jgi:two-component system phosphate regulon response regulator OmpR